MNKTTIIVSVVALLVGTGIGQGIKAPKPEIQTVIKEVPVEKIVEVEKNRANWEGLKTIDDQAFVVAGEQMTLCSQGYTAVANLDTKEITRIATEVKAKTSSLNLLSTQRQAVLKKLGY